MLLHEAVNRWAEQTPDATALVAGDRSWTFAQLGGSVEAVRCAVARTGAVGDRVAFVGPNHPAWVAAYFGVPAAGRVLSFVNHRLAPQDIAAAIERADPVLVVGPQRWVPAGRAHVEPDDFVDWCREQATATAADPDAGHPHGERRADDVVWHIPTSGTSGTPKTVELTHASILAAVATTIGARPLRGDEVYLFPFPLCHVAGYNVVLHLVAGATVVLVDTFTAAGVLDACVTHGVTHMSLAPTMISALCDELESSPRPLRSLRAVTYGSAPIAPTLLRRAITVLGCDFMQGYGMTELSGNAVFLGAAEHRDAVADRPDLIGVAGRPGPGVELRLVDDAGAMVAPGEPGEILVRAPQVMAGYRGDPEATAAALADGWLHTGDIGRLDAAGYLRIVDRKKDIIISGGENIASREVEDLLLEHPDISEVAVVGLADPYWGEVVAAAVVPRIDAELDPATVLAFGRERIGGFKKPTVVEILEALPRNGSGKVVKAEVRELLAARRVAP
jgi:acyl-CoA synthetase (AMP-forming)/AMP-acid ligase II